MEQYKLSDLDFFFHCVAASNMRFNVYCDGDVDSIVYEFAGKDYTDVNKLALVFFNLIDQEEHNMTFDQFKAELTRQLAFFAENARETHKWDIGRDLPDPNDEHRTWSHG